MKRKSRIKQLSIFLLLTAMLLALTGCSGEFLVLDPKGPVGEAQKDLIWIATILCAVIIVPVLLLTLFIVLRYRDKPGSKASYKPDWAHSNKLEAIWWGIPIVIVAALAVITVNYTYKLEPSKPLESAEKPITIQVTSLDWKWLFKYPEQGIATVNYAYIPEGVPIQFQLTSDAPMNSFWIPQLGGQIYTMSGMAMKLYLQADEPGQYYGTGANFSGKDFAKMRFTVHAVSKEEFQQWASEVKQSAPALTMEGYQQLAEPGVSEEQSFSSFPLGLFESIVTKYGTDGHGGHHHGAVQEPQTTDAEAHHESTDAAHSEHSATHSETNQHAGH